MIRHLSKMKLLAVAAALPLAVTACGGGSSPNTPPPKLTGYNAATTGIVNASNKPGGTLNLISSGDCDSWDPARTYYAFCWDMQRLFERTLMAYAAAPGAAGTQVVPDLASAPGTANADATVWTYHLRSGIKFQTGAVITSQDIKYAIERIFATTVISGGPTYVICLLTTCNASGASPYLGPYGAGHPSLSSIVTPDANTIVFHLVKPYSDWNYIMALPGSAPVPAALDTGAKYALKPVASGPYEFVSYSPGKSASWIRNPYWVRSTDPIRKALPDAISLLIDSNPADVDSHLLAGTADVDIGGTGVQSAAQAKIVTTPALKANADDPTDNFVRYFTIDPTVPPLNNKACRLAIMYALNKSDLQLARGGDYAGKITGSMLAPNIAGFDSTFDPYPNGAGNTGDLAMAKQELTACGHPHGFSTHMAYINEGKSVKVFNAAQQALARVGITLLPGAGQASSYYSTWVGTPASIVQHNLGMTQYGWGADFPTGVGWWYSIVDGQAIAVSGGNSNIPSLNDPIVNNDINALEKTTDPATRASLDHQIDVEVMNQADFAPFLDEADLTYRNPRVTDIYIQGSFGIYDFVSLGVVS
ncbi:MAG TPA: ABC transporter substrate-binding protein [Mycobacteriales bacterium]|nr:ABC transporter substrate-binding protein [Mycobacteriales bacterium]